MNETRTIEFVTHRCFGCRTWWAIEKWRDGLEQKCPFCAAENIKAANERANAAERSRNSLKGALTRLRKARR